MRILVDSREQLPLLFETDAILIGVNVVTLPVGDYTASYADGSRCPIYFERKSLPDLFGTLTTGHRRFRDELSRAAALNIKLVLAVEGTIEDVLRGHEYSTVEGVTILRTMMTMWLKYDLTPMFFRNRWEMALGIKEFYMAFGRNFKKQKGAGHAESG